MESDAEREREKTKREFIYYISIHVLLLFFFVSFFPSLPCLIMNDRMDDINTMNQMNSLPVSPSSPSSPSSFSSESDVVSTVMMDKLVQQTNEAHLDEKKQVIIHEKKRRRDMRKEITTHDSTSCSVFDSFIYFHAHMLFPFSLLPFVSLVVLF